MKFVFFTPTMERTGSEIIINSIISKTIHAPLNQALVITRRLGGLAKDATLPTITIENTLKGNNLINKIIKWIIKNNKVYLRRLLYCHVRELYPNSVWVVNTVTQGDVIRFAKKHHIKTILFAHEREHMYKSKDISIQVGYPELLIACSETALSVAKKLGRTKPTAIVYPGIDTEWLHGGSLPSDSLREKLNISKTAFIWGMSGTVDTNKNPLRFLELAKELKKNRDIAFIWIGKINDNQLYESVRSKQKEWGLDDLVHWSGELDRSQLKIYMQALNAFVLTSDYESFPVATIEALALGKTVFSFDCGGIREILTNDIGAIHPDHNIIAAADTMREIMDGKRTYSIDKMRQRALEYSIDKTVASWDVVINDFMNHHA